MSVVAATRARLLLVDDSPVMRKAAAKMLGEEFDVVTATDGVDAWEKIQADTDIQVIFTDLSMPRMDGYALLQKIRAAEDEGTLKMPVIVVTGAENDDAARIRALDLGATDFITKPFGSIDLLARARAHANYRRIAQKLEAQVPLDGLTGLANKVGFLDRLQHDIAVSRRHSKPLSVARIEIDDFRSVFLKHGKASAEALIQHVAQTLRGRVRKEDTAARIGLAAFALALPAGQQEGSRGLVERMRAQFESDVVAVAGKPLGFSISAAVWTPELHASLSAAEALDACEKLLQTALQAGGNRVLGQTSTGRLEGAAEGAESDAAPLAVAPPEASARAESAAPVPEAAALKPAQHPPPLTATAVEPDASPEPAPTIKASPQSQATIPGQAPDPRVLIDEALQRIERGESQSILSVLPQLITRLLPLLRLLSTRQRAQLVSFLQKLGG